MITPLYYPERVNIETIPANFIVSSEELAALIDSISQMDCIPIDIESLIEFIMEGISNEDNALTTLSYKALELVRENLHNGLGDEVVKIMELAVQFGKHLYDTFKRLGVYINGYLPYQLRELLRNEIIFTRVDNHIPGARNMVSKAGVGEWF